MSQKSARHLRLVSPDMYEGPITRLDLWYRFPKVETKQLFLYIALKLLVISSMVYYIYG